MLYLLLVTSEAPGVLSQQNHDKLTGTRMLTLSIDHRGLNECVYLLCFLPWLYHTIAN